MKLTKLDVLGLDALGAIDRLEKGWGDCHRCELAIGRTKIVHWRGNPNAKILVIGEAPGADEDASGTPFVGRAGRLLDELLALAGLDAADDVAITNVVACRPPANRTPRREEVKACSRRLALFIRIADPDVIVLLGATAAKLAGVHSISAHRGSLVEVELDERFVKPAVATFHPSYLLRAHNAEDRRDVIRDLELAARQVSQ